jgi:methane/ammonia monooxygenase subunit B
VFIRTERYLNGQASVSSVALKLGGDYDFKIVLKARLPGRYHLHPFFNLHDAGAVMGPGHWLTPGEMHALAAFYGAPESAQVAIK